ncbi:MAG: VTT domain-containing protein [Candidatus Woesearchaeota archaeon]
MGITEQMLTWTKTTFLPLGMWGLFFLAFIESIFFPIPPDVLLIALSLRMPEQALWFALITTIGSTLGGLGGYYLGERVGRPLLRKITTEEKIDKTHALIKKYDFLAIVIGAFSPLPYKVFSISAGIVKMKKHLFVLATVVGRAPRFFAEALLIMWFGDSILMFLESWFNWITLLVSVLLIFLVVLAAFWIRKKNPKKSMKTNLKK